MDKTLTELEYNILTYLPYNPPIEILNYKNDNVGIQFSKTTGYYLLDNKLYITYEGGHIGKSISDFKLRLKPLSCLTEGELYFELPISVIFNECKRIADQIIRNRIETNTLLYSDYIVLIKNNIDIFNMIDEGNAFELIT